MLCKSLSMQNIHSGCLIKFWSHGTLVSVLLQCNIISFLHCLGQKPFEKVQP